MNQDLIQEWKILHNNHEKYEQYALLIKLFAIAISFIYLTSSIVSSLFILLLGVLWLQEAIWKTYQARLSDRIEQIERAQVDKQTIKFNPFQFYSEWSKQRPKGLSLVLEYLKNALKPTVIFPYMPLMAIILI